MAACGGRGPRVGQQRNGHVNMELAERDIADPSVALQALTDLGLDARLVWDSSEKVGAELPVESPHAPLSQRAWRFTKICRRPTGPRVWRALRPLRVPDVAVQPPLAVSLLPHDDELHGGRTVG